MDSVFWLSASVVFMAVAFAGICWWAFSPSRRKKFEDAANLPFADDTVSVAQDRDPEPLPSTDERVNDTKAVIEDKRV